MTRDELEALDRLGALAETFQVYKREKGLDGETLWIDGKDRLNCEVGGCNRRATRLRIWRLPWCRPHYHFRCVRCWQREATL